MSRHPQQLHKTSITHDVDTEMHVNFIATNAVPKAMTLEEVKTAAEKDCLFQHAINIAHTGQWHRLYDHFTTECDRSDLKSFYNVREELTVLDDRSVFLRGHRIVMPRALQHKALDLGHQGLVKTKQLLREKVWFPGIDKQAEQLISACIPCQASTTYNKHQPLQMSELPEGPWQNVSVDFCGPFPSGDYLLDVLDEYSRFPFVEITPVKTLRTSQPTLVFTIERSPPTGLKPMVRL